MKGNTYSHEVNSVQDSCVNQLHFSKKNKTVEQYEESKPIFANKYNITYCVIERKDKFH